MRISPPLPHEQWFCWYLHNALSSASGGLLVQSVRQYLLYLNPAASARRLAEYSSLAIESQKLEGRRRSFLRFLAKYADRPEPVDPVVAQNLQFLRDAFDLDNTDIAILELVTNASQIANVDMFAANVCSTLRNPARSIGALIGVDSPTLRHRIATTA